MWWCKHPCFCTTEMILDQCVAICWRELEFHSKMPLQNHVSTASTAFSTDFSLPPLYATSPLHPPFPGLSINAIDEVEILGGSCRTPAVKDIIMETFQRELSTTLNLDEAVARGCALQCAMLSPTFKVRDFNIADIQPYPIKLRWQAAMEGEEG